MQGPNEDERLMRRNVRVALPIGVVLSLSVVGCGGTGLAGTSAGEGPGEFMAPSGHVSYIERYRVRSASGGA